MDSGPEVLFIGYPNLGLLDQWLPILHRVKEKRPKTRICAVLLESRVALQARREDSLIFLGKSIFDGVLLRTWHGSWLQAKTFQEAARLHSSEGYLLTPGWLNKPVRKAYEITGLLPLVGLARMISRKKASVNLDNLRGSVKAILCDIDVGDLSVYDDIRLTFESSTWFSLNHGILPRSQSVPNGQRQLDRVPTPSIIYANTNNEIAYYWKKYQIRRENVKAVGVPRHEGWWVSRVIKSAEVKAEYRQFIFIISRPANPDYFPRESKIEALRDIKRLADKIGLRVLVRLHPKEQEEGLYEQIFGEDNYGSFWEISSAHPFALGQKAVFAISFFSGIPVDMIRVSCPTIERYDPSVLETTPAIRNKLAFPARDYGELEKHAMQILKYREKMVDELKKEYSDHYDDPDGSSELISNDLIGVVIGEQAT